EMAVNKATKKRRLGSVLKGFMGDLSSYLRAADWEDSSG
ncbi:MAG: hypothetical protein QOE88_487, partial [Verrucomicrobiota bacterium]|nr:hypothetical protein [Verrucomicrobiota bacterium]